MDTQKIDDLQKKASGFLGESVRILKDGLREAGRLISATADATKMHIEKESKVLGTHREYHRLGEEVYRWVKENASANDVPLSKTMKDTVRRIRTAEKEIARRKERLNHLTVVDVSERPAKVAAQKTRTVGAKKTVPRRTNRTRLPQTIRR